MPCDLLMTMPGAWYESWKPFYRLLSQHGLRVHVAPAFSPRRLSELRETGCFADDCGENAWAVHPLPVRCQHPHHAASYWFGAQAAEFLRSLAPRALYLLGEAGYASTYQLLRIREAAYPRAKALLYAAQNVYKAYPFPFSRFERYTFEQVDMALPLGEEHLAVLRRKGYRGPAFTLPLGVDTDHFRPQEVSELRSSLGLPPKIVGFVGLLVKQRDVIGLTRAVAALGREVGLLLLAKGPLLPEVQAEIGRLGIANRTRVIGYVPHREVPRYLNCMDVMALPSVPVQSGVKWWIRIPNKEQFGRVLIEAMACETAVVGSDCGEIPHVIGDCGLVYPSGDRAALTESLRTLLADDARRKSLAARGRERAVRHYDWGRVVARFLEVYRPLVEGVA